jgi:hypothetical protein
MGLNGYRNSLFLDCWYMRFERMDYMPLHRLLGIDSLIGMFSL